MRILRDPAATDAAGGGTTPPTIHGDHMAPGTLTASHVAPTVQAPPAPPPPATPPMVPLTVEEYQRLRDVERQLGDVRAEQQRALDAAEAVRLKAVADKEGAEQALQQQKTAWEAKVNEERAERTKLESQYLTEKKRTAIDDALVAYKFRDHAQPFVRRELEAKLSAARDATGAIVVRDTLGRPAADVIKETLATPEFALFLQPASAGGAGAGGGDKPPPAPETPTIPKTLGERIIAETLAAGGNPMPRSFSPQLFTQTAPGRN